MNLIVDANIIFSGILNTNSKIGDLLINSSSYFHFLAPQYLRKEIKNHYPRLQTISSLNLNQIQESEFQIYKCLTFISEEQIPLPTWSAAEVLANDIDPNDIVYVALSLHFNCKIWSGDKKLTKGLQKKGFSDIFDTASVYDIREKLKER